MTIKEIICEIKENEEIAWDRDSLEIMMMVERLEQSYGCSIKGTEIVPENFASIEAIQEMVVRNGGQI